MHRRLTTLALAVGLLVSATASAVTIGYRPRTGDIWIDTHLTDINRYGRMDTDYFIDDLVASFGAPRYFVRDLLTVRRWEPADVYYACALAYQVNRPCVDVVRDYGDDRGQGWGVIAQRLGIKPGSEAFHALKGRVGKSGDRYHARFPDRTPVHPSSHGGAPGQSGKDKGNGHGAAPANAPGKGKDKGAGQGQGHGQGKDKKGHGH